MIHTPGWVHLGHIVVVTESVDTVVEAEAAACSLNVDGDIGDNHRGVAPDTRRGYSSGRAAGCGDHREENSLQRIDCG